ncbi:hypothetical protein CE195_03280 [Sodalis-like symbiont of Philaenus spumarius]|nr:hypothetical protein CE195_03280 [Sodalis-like symbiont of Philaenus spumarius]
MVDMAFNGAGVRDTARTFKMVFTAKLTGTQKGCAIGEHLCDDFDLSLSEGICFQGNAFK